MTLRLLNRDCFRQNLLRVGYADCYLKVCEREQSRWLGSDIWGEVA